VYLKIITMDNKDLGNTSRRDFIAKSVIASAGAMLGGSVLTSFAAERRMILKITIPRQLV
jgi:hypothetical protein